MQDHSPSCVPPQIVIMAQSRMLLSVAGLALCLSTASAAFVATGAVAFIGPNPGMTPLGESVLGLYDAGYIYVSNVQSYVNMTLDYCDIVVSRACVVATRERVRRRPARHIVTAPRPCLTSHA
jgi:hypothetical protein